MVLPVVVLLVNVSACVVYVGLMEGDVSVIMLVATAVVVATIGCNASKLKRCYDVVTVK